MLKIGVTGGIGSGKTTVCKLFENLGIPVYYADERAKSLMVADKELKSGIKSLFGSESYFSNGRLNRKYIATKVFNDSKLLKELNKLVHPAVFKDGEKWFLQQKSKFALKEAALLIESGNYKTLDKIIVVTAPEEIRIARVMKRDRISIEKVKARIKNQLSEKAFLKHADYIIVNDGFTNLEQAVKKIYKDLIRSAK